MTFALYWNLVVRRWKLIIICFLLVGAGASIGTKLTHPLYQSSALVQVVVGSGADYTSLLASDQLVQTESVLVTSDAVLRDVASHYTGLSAEQLAREVKSSVKLNTQLFEIDVLDTSPTRAAALTNDIAVTLVKRQNQLTGQGTIQINLLIVQPAQPSSTPAQPNKLLNIGAGLLTGLLLGMLLVVLVEQLDWRIRDLAVLDKLLDWPIMAIFKLIPSPQKGRKGEREAAFNPIGHNSNIEPYRMLRTNIKSLRVDKLPRSLMVTSAVPQEGKSVIAVNLAIFLARAGTTTLLIDANLHHPTLHHLLDLSKDKLGLSDALFARNSSNILNASFSHQLFAPVSPMLSENTQAITSIQKDCEQNTTDLPLASFVHLVDIPNLWLMPAGALALDTSDLLDSKGMQHLLTEILHSGVEMVIFDTPPVLGLSDGSILASKVDGTLVVVDITQADKRNLKQMKSLLIQANAHVLGFVVNKQSRRNPDTTYSYRISESKRESDRENTGISSNRATIFNVNTNTPSDVVDALNDVMSADTVKIPLRDKVKAEQCESEDG